ncbi:MAG: hypothetical protein AAFX94_06220, partial [Myxococcota bacterium]
MLSLIVKLLQDCLGKFQRRSDRGFTRFVLFVGENPSDKLTEVQKAELLAAYAPATGTDEK